MHEAGSMDDLENQIVTLLGQGSVAEALSITSIGLELEPDNGNIWQLRGLLERHMNLPEAACTSFLTAMALVPLSAASRCALAECYIRTGRRELARELYLALVEEDSCPTPLLAALASGLGTLGENTEALRVCRRLAIQRPDMPEAPFAVAFYLRRLGAPFDEARRYVERAHELNPSSACYRLVLASYFVRDGNLGRAHELLCEVDPQAITCKCCLDRMIRIHQHQGDTERVTACLERIAELGGSCRNQDHGEPGTHPGL